MSELPEWWTGPYPEVGSAQTAAAYIDALGGALSRRQENGSWVLTTGTQDLLRAESESELDTFVLGFALAHLIVERHGLIGPRPAPAAEVPVLAVVPEAVPGGDFESSTVADLDAGDDAPDSAESSADDEGIGGGGGGGARRRGGGRNRRR